MSDVTHLNIQHHSLRSSVRCVHETVSRVVVQTSFPLSLQCHVTHKQLNQSQSRNLCHHYNYSHFLLSTRNTCFIFTCPFRNLFTLILGSQFVINHLFLGIKIVFIVKKGFFDAEFNYPFYWKTKCHQQLLGFLRRVT